MGKILRIFFKICLIFISIVAFITLLFVFDVLKNDYYKLIQTQDIANNNKLIPNAGENALPQGGAIVVRGNADDAMNTFDNMKKNGWTETTTVNAESAGIRTIEKDGEKINIGGISTSEQNYIDAGYESPTTLDLLIDGGERKEIKFTNTNN